MDGSSHMCIGCNILYGFALSKIDHVMSKSMLLLFIIYIYNIINNNNNNNKKKNKNNFFNLSRFVSETPFWEEGCYIYIYREDCIKKSCIEIPFFFCVYIIYKTVYINLSNDRSFQLLLHN